MTTLHRRGGAVATYVLVILIALLIGAAAMWTYRGDKPESALPAVATDSVTTHGEWVSIKRGRDSIRAYVAYPERKTKAPAVIVIHEIFGLTDWERTVADRLAKEGYVAILPDRCGYGTASPAGKRTSPLSPLVEGPRPPHPSQARGGTRDGAGGPAGRPGRAALRWSAWSLPGSSSP